MQASTKGNMHQLVLQLTMNDHVPIRGMNTTDHGQLFSVYDVMANTGSYAPDLALYNQCQRFFGLW